MQKYLIIPALALSLGVAQPALALDDQPGANRLNVPHAQWLTPAQVTEKLQQQGYKVREIEADDGAYEVEMVDKNGVQVEANVHPATAEILVGSDD